MFKVYAVLIFIGFSVVESINVKKNEFSIEGKVEINDDGYKGWTQETRILINGGEFIGHLRDNGTFVINGLKTGVYDVIAATNQWHDFFPFTVKVSPDGKVCAQRIVNFAQESSRRCDPYPLVIRRKFHPREVKNKPVILETDNYIYMLVIVGGILMLEMLRMMNPIEAQEERAEVEANERRQQRAPIRNIQVMNFMDNLPDISMWLTNFFSRWFPLDPPKNQTQRRNKSKKAVPTLPAGRKQKRKQKRRKC